MPVRPLVSAAPFASSRTSFDGSPEPCPVAPLRSLVVDGEVEQTEIERTIRSFALGDEDLRAWERSGLPEAAFEDWLTDRVARRPSGTRARQVYGAEDAHDFARRPILDALHLTTADALLEIGFGGGLLLRDALATGARATGIDHSEEMTRLAREWAPAANLVVGRAEELPFADDAFTAVAMSVVFFFFDRPGTVLGECHRAVRHGGRLAVYTTAPELRGTPAAPEPLASHGHFYSDHELVELGRRARFDDVSVTNDGGGQLLTAVRR